LEEKLLASVSVMAEKKKTVQIEPIGHVRDKNLS